MKILKDYDTFINENMWTDIKKFTTKVGTSTAGLVKSIASSLGFKGTDNDFAQVFLRINPQNNYLYNYFFLKKIGKLKKLNVEWNATPADVIEGIKSDVDLIIKTLGRSEAAKKLKVDLDDIGEGASYIPKDYIPRKQKDWKSSSTDEEDLISKDPESEVQFGEEMIKGKAPIESQVSNYTHKQLLEEIKRSYHTNLEGSTNTMMIWGLSGIGKSNTVRDAAKELGCNCYVWMLSSAIPTDLKGPLVPDFETKRSAWYLPQLFPCTEKDKDGNYLNSIYPTILFLDEVNRAPIDTLNASLSLLLDHKVDDYDLPKEWHVICAGNWAYDADEEDAKKQSKSKQQVRDMDVAARTRLAHVNLVLSARDWLKWAKYTYKNPANKGEVGLNSDIVEFLTYQKQYIRKSSNPDAKTFANPRSWVLASNALDALYDDKEKTGEIPDLRDIYKCISKYCTREIAGYFTEFLKLKKVYPVKDLNLVWSDPNKAPLIGNGKEVPDPEHQLALTSMIMNTKPFTKFDTKDPKVNEWVTNLAIYLLRYDNDESLSIMSGVVKKYINVSLIKGWTDLMVKRVAASMLKGIDASKLSALQQAVLADESGEINPNVKKQIDIEKSKKK